MELIQAKEEADQFKNFCEGDAIAKANPDAQVGQRLVDAWGKLSEEEKASYQSPDFYETKEDVTAEGFKKEPKEPPKEKEELKEKKELVGYAAAVASESHQRVREQLSEFGAAVAPFAEEALHRLWQLQAT